MYFLFKIKKPNPNADLTCLGSLGSRAGSRPHLFLSSHFHGHEQLPPHLQSFSYLEKHKTSMRWTSFRSMIMLWVRQNNMNFLLTITIPNTLYRKFYNYYTSNKIKQVNYTIIDVMNLLWGCFVLLIPFQKYYKWFQFQPSNSHLFTWFFKMNYLVFFKWVRIYLNLNCKFL